MVEFETTHNSLTCYQDNEILNIVPWGRDGIRVRATRLNAIKHDWISALINQGNDLAQIEINESGARLRTVH
jgi:hypothetical protein